MTIKDRLNNYYALDLEIEQLNERILEDRERMTSLRSSSDLSAIAASRGDTDKIGDIVASIADRECRHYSRIHSIMEEQSYIERLVDQLVPVERLLVRARYMDCIKWKEVCKLIGYGSAQAYRIHSGALTKLEEIEKEKIVEAV